jgi:hypothetical protein
MECAAHLFLLSYASHKGLLLLPLPWFLVQAPAGSPPDVWVQLLEKYAADPEAQPAVISSVAQQLQQQLQSGCKSRGSS